MKSSKHATKKKSFTNTYKKNPQQMNHVLKFSHTVPQHIKYMATSHKPFVCVPLHILSVSAGRHQSRS